MRDNGGQQGLIKEIESKISELMQEEKAQDDPYLKDLVALVHQDFPLDK